MAVIGCDGINSRVRETMFGSENPISHPNYSHKAAYRSLIPMDKAVEALGEYKAKKKHMHIGPKAHVLHFPVVNQTMMNVVAFVSDPEKWPDDNKLDVLANRADLEAAFADWGHSVRSIIQLLPEQLNKWAVFDTYDHPVPYYSAGQVCLAGDAAHAACPHHGAGAGVGIEDARCLASVFEEVMHAVIYTDTPKSEILTAAFESYNFVRHERTQWLIRSSREVCDIYEWADSATGEDPEKCFEEIKWRSHKIWYFDFTGMVTDVKKDFNQRI
jgi:salicylate hydroxylase